MMTTTDLPSTREAFAWLWRLCMMLRPYWPGLRRNMGIGVALSAAGLIPPYLGKLLFDDVYPGGDVSLLHVIVAVTAGFALALAWLGLVRSYFMTVVNARLTAASQILLFEHLQRLPLRFFEGHRVGEVMTRFGDLRNAISALTSMVETVVLRGTYVLLLPPLLLYMNWRLALVAFAVVPLTAGVNFLSARLRRRLHKHSAEATADAQAAKLEAISQVRTVKSLALEEPFAREMQRLTIDAQNATLRSAAVGATMGAVAGTVRALGAAVTSLVAWTMVIRGDMSLGTFMAFGAYSAMLMAPANQIAGLAAGFQRTIVTLQRAFEYLDLEPESDGRSSAFPDTRPRTGEPLRLVNVSFGYHDTRLALDTISTVFEPGLVHSIVGPSGAGKSSLLRLLTGLDQPRTGTVSLGDVPVADIPPRILRSRVVTVWHDSGLFRGTLHQNLLIGGVAASDAELREVLELVGLSDFAQNLPLGLDTPVSEWGASVSAGQKQRLGIARALLRRPETLLLDEATGNVDLVTEMALVRGLIASHRIGTILFVTHRPAVAALADRILVLEAGRVSGEGTHAELLESSAHYRSVWKEGQGSTRNDLPLTLDAARRRPQTASGA